METSISITQHSETNYLQYNLLFYSLLREYYNSKFSQKKVHSLTMSGLIIMAREGYLLLIRVGGSLYLENNRCFSLLLEAVH